MEDYEAGNDHTTQMRVHHGEKEVRHLSVLE